jgi:hypothetical protein
MAKEVYHIFADEAFKDEYGLPKLHFRTSTINLNADWSTLAAFLRKYIKLDKSQPIYKVPEELKGVEGLRDLTQTEIEKFGIELKLIAEEKQN